MDTAPIPPPAPVPVATSAEDKTAAILAYITLFGFIVAIIIHNGKKTKLGAYHLRQALGLFITGFVLGMIGVIPIIGWIMIPFILIGMFVFVILGLISAINGQMKPVPLLGEKYQQWFSSAFE